MIQLAELNNQINFRIDCLVNYKSKLIEEVMGLENRNHRLLLIYRYIDGLKWEEVAERMNYDVSTVYKLHGEALDCFHHQFASKF